MKKNTHNVSLTLGGTFLVLFLLALVTYIPLRAQPVASLTDPGREPDERVRRFFNDVLAGKGSQALDDLLSASSEREALTEVKKKLEDIRIQCGNFRNYERHVVKSVGEDLVFVQYLLKCDRQPVIWTFTFYRRPTETGSLSTTSSPWHVIGLRFDTNLDPLLQTLQSQTR